MNDEIRMPNHELPDGWTSAAIQELGNVQLGKMLDRAKNSGTSAAYLRNINVRWHEFDLTDLKTVLVSDEERERFSVLDGDLFICEGGEPGRSAVWKGGKSEAIYQKALHRFRTHGAILPELLMYCFRLEAEAGSLHESFSGSTIKHFTRESLIKYKVPLPPLPEQKRIADKLEAVLGRVDACRARLDRVPDLLKRFRQSVLAAATSGKLTEDWRMTNGVNDEWKKAPLGSVIDEIKNGLSPKPKEQPPGTPILRISSVRTFQVHQSDIRYLSPSVAVEPYRLKVGDLLFTRYNGSLEFVGVCGLVRKISVKGLVYPDKLIRVRVNREEVLPDWIEIAVNSPQARDVIENKARTSAGQTGISGKDLKELFVPVPTLPEQQEIVRRVEDLFAFADRIEARLATAQKTVERLTPATLAKAFRGELVPQDPNDEPVSVLLERLALQRADPPRKAKARRKPKTV